jgi:hypothetical protein
MRALWYTKEASSIIPTVGDGIELWQCDGLIDGAPTTGSKISKAPPWFREIFNRPSESAAT